MTEKDYEALVELAPQGWYPKTREGFFKWSLDCVRSKKISAKEGIMLETMFKREEISFQGSKRSDLL